MRNYPVLPRAEVKKALRFAYPLRPPLAQSLWHNAETLHRHGDALRRVLVDYPDDVVHASVGWQYWEAPEDNPGFRWAFGNKQKPEGVGIDSQIVLEDWSELDQLIAELPDAGDSELTKNVAGTASEYPERYLLVSFGHFFHQRLAYLRGLENLMYDFFDAPDKLRKLMTVFLEIYEVWIKRVAQLGADGIWGGDDLGHQHSLFMAPRQFREIYKPFYRELVDMAHQHGLDVWLHTCGNICDILTDLIDAGIDAVHPIQVGTMNEEDIIAKGSGKIAFWVGMDVQHLLPEGSPADIRREVYKRMRLFFRKQGGLVLAAGNAIGSDVPLENIQAYVETIRKPID